MLVTSARRISVLSVFENSKVTVVFSSVSILTLSAFLISRASYADSIQVSTYVLSALLSIPRLAMSSIVQN